MDIYQEQPSRTLEDYWAIFMRRRWWLILPMFLTWALILGGSRFIPPKFRSETVIIVGQQRGPEQYVVPNFSTDVQERLQSMTQQILSRTRLEGIIRKFGLYGQSQGSENSDAAVERMRQDIKLDVIPSAGRPWELSAFKVSYSAPHPALAQQVTSELTSLFIAENLSSWQRSSENTIEFLDAELRAARQNLDQQDERLQEFKSKYTGELPEQLQSNVQTLSALQTRLQMAQEAVDEANQQEMYLESMQSPGLQGGDAGSPISVDAELRKLQAEYADLSSRYTSSHPDVRRVKARIAFLEKLQQEPAADAGPAKAGKKDARADSSTVRGGRVASMDGQSRSNRFKITHREQDVKRLERQIEDYQRRLNIMPLREQELAVITRDHDQARTNYESLMAKKNQSEIATNLEKSRQGEMFRIIDPPNLPQKPFWPDRFKFSLLGLALGMVLAAGITALAETLDARIYREDELREMVRLPILSGIPVLHTGREQTKERRFQRFEAIAASFLLTLISAMTLFTYYRG